jgi:inhibitor of cysteine peptidase
MRKNSIVAVVLVMACALGAPLHAADESVSLSASLNKPFSIAVESNPTTGYSWSAEFDASKLTLTSSSYEKPADPRPGAGGKQVFVFTPLKQGDAEVTLLYRRPWEKETVKTNRYKIKVSP